MKNLRLIQPTGKGHTGDYPNIYIFCYNHLYIANAGPFHASALYILIL